MIMKANRSQGLQDKLAGWTPRRANCVVPVQEPRKSHVLVQVHV